MKLTNTNATELNRLRCLVHGDSGIGKTTSLGTLPKNTVLAVCERGVIPLRGKDIPTIYIETWSDMQLLLRMFSRNIDDDARKKAAESGYGEMLEVCQSAKTLAVDSLSAISDLCKRNIIDVDRRRLVMERTSDKRDTPEKVYDDLMTQEDWGLYGTRIWSLLSAFAHLPVHLVMTSLSKFQENKKTGDLKWVPNLNGAKAFECPALFDLVVYMTNNDGERMWLTEHTEEVVAKDASGVLDKYVEPDWTKVFKKILVDKPVTAKKKDKKETVNVG